MVKRYCMIYELRPEHVKNYIEAHRNCWSEVSRAMRAAGAENLVIYVYDNFSIIIYECEDFSKWLEKLNRDEEHNKWSMMIRYMFREIPDFENTLDFKTLPKIYDMKESLKEPSEWR